MDIPIPVAAIHRASALWTIAPGVCELRPESLRPPNEGEAMVRTLVSGISRGTESLVLAGRVPDSERQRMRAPFQDGDFPFPVKYGYSAVGVVESGPADWLGRRVFALHPHQDRFVVPVTALRIVPPGIPDRRAALAANLETALNAVWDARPGPGDRIAIVGGGLVGSLIAAILSRMPAVAVTLIDIDATRAERARLFGIDFALPEAATGDFDCVFHVSATQQGLQTALDLAGPGAEVIEVSWYGDAPVSLRLGGGFHSRRLRLVSSQVGQIPAERRGRFDYARRMGVAMTLLADDRLDTLIGQIIPFAETPGRMADALADGSGRCPVIQYPFQP